MLNILVPIIAVTLIVGVLAIFALDSNDRDIKDRAIFLGEFWVVMVGAYVVALLIGK